MVTNNTRLINLALRGATLGTRFLFIFFLAKYLDPASVGYYGIFTVTVGYAMYFVGLDFYTYVSREIIKTPANQRGRLLKGQAALSGLLYLALLPLAIWLLAQSGWPGHLVWWFLPILFLEHVNQEIFRLLNTLSEQVASSLILFIRQGAWSIASVAMMYFDGSTRSLDVVMALWAIAGVVAAYIGVRKLEQLRTRGWGLPIDWPWVRKGIAISIAFLVATLAARGVLTFDRYWIESLGGVEVVGAYVLLLGMANILILFVDAVLLSFAHPTLIKLNFDGKRQESRKMVKQLLLQTLAFSSVFGLVSSMLLPFFLAWVGNPVYLEYVSLYPWLLSAMTINGVSMVLHSALYARGADQSIIYSHLGALLTFCLTTWVLSASFSVTAVLVGLNAAFIFVLFWKSFAYWLLLKNESVDKGIPSHI